MEINTVQTSNLELLGRVIDGKATSRERVTVLYNMTDPFLEEFLLIAMKAKVLFNDREDGNETF